MKKHSKNLSIIVLIILAVEVFVFNFSSIKSLFYNNYLVVNEENIKMNGIVYDEDKSKYKVMETENYIEITNINQETKNLYLDLNISMDTYNIIINYIDDSFKNYERNSLFETKLTKYITKDMEKTKYMQLELSGKTNSIKIYTNLIKYSYFTIDSISFNKVRPIFFNATRVLILIILSFFIYSFFKVKEFNIKLKERNKFQNNILIFSTILFLLFSFIVYNNTKNGYSQSNYSDLYSKYYVDSLIEKKYSIKDNYLYELNKIDNVFDASEMYKNHYLFYSIMDTSYYNKTLYMYFGIFPALIQTAYKIITGNYLFHDTLTFIVFILTTIYIVKLIKKLILKFFPNTSFKLSLLLIMFFLFNSKILLLIYQSSFYDMLIMFGIFLSVFGLYRYLIGIDNKKNLNFLVASLSLALAVACRPTMILISIIPFVLLFKELKSDRKLFIYYIVPYIIIGLFLAIFNYIRFDNIFDFGQKYQITITNMQTLGVRWYAIKNGIWSYLLSFPTIIPTFPFVINNDSLPFHLTFYFNSNTFGGIIPMSILGFLIFYLPFVSKKMIKSDKVVSFIIFSTLLLSLFLLVMSSNIGGSTNRYAAEIAWIFLISIVMFVLYLINNHNTFKNNTFKTLLLIIVLLSIFMNSLIIFDDKNNTKSNLPNNTLFYNTKALFE